jgi:hypothetical protein
MWNVKTNVIPVIIGTTGTISKSFRKYLSKTRNRGTREKAVLGTAYLLWKVLMSKFNRFKIGNSVICTMKSNYR